MDIDEAIAVKGRRNNRAIAEQMVGKCLLSLVVVFVVFNRLLLLCVIDLFVFRDVCEPRGS